jgi:hypothetical protein
MKKPIILFGLLASSFTATGQDMSNGADNFYKSDKLIAQKITFNNQYQMKVVANLFMPEGMDQSVKHPAIVVGHPMGAVKVYCSPKSGQVAKIEKRPEYEQQESGRQAPAAA